MALAHQYQYMKVQIGTVDFTGYLANTEQTATMPASSEVGRATLTFRDDGSMPAIPKWGTVVISSGTAAPGTPVWGGYATRQSSEPASIHGGMVRLVTVDCQSYSIALSTTAPITTTFGGGDNESLILDNTIVDNLVQAYLPAFYDAGSISSASPVQCDYIQFSSETLRSSLNKIVERSAKEYGITAGADFYYRPTGSAGTVAIQLTDAPDYDERFPMQAKPYSDIDDVDIRNAVRVVGGWTLSPVQDESFTTDGIAYSFQVAHFPQDIIRVRLSNIVLSVGVYLVDPPADFDVLVHYDQRKFIFQLPPPGGKTLEIEYRYPVRVEETVTDAASIAAVGGTIWGQTIEDSSISDATVAQLIGSAYLARMTQSNELGQVTTSWVGEPYLPGQTILVSANALGWDVNELEIKSVAMRFAPRPGGTGSCLTYWDLDVGRLRNIGHTMGGVYLDAPDIRIKTFAPNIREAIAAGDVPTLPQYLLATGATTGASSQAQTFTNGIIGPSWKPASDSTTALQMTNAAGTAILTVNTTASKMTLSGIQRFDSSASNTKLEFVTLDSTSYGSQIDFIYGSTYKHSLRAYRSGSTYLIDLYDVSGKSPWVMIPASGFMGVNRDVPTAHLHVGNDYPNVGIQVDVVDWAEKTAFQIYMPDYSAPTLVFTTHGGAVFNERGLDTDFRVEGDTVTHLLFVDGGTDRVGIGTASPATPLHVTLNNATTNAVDALLTLAHNSTGTPTTYFGAGIAFNLQSSTTADQPAATLNTYLADATHATLSAAVAVNTVYQGTLAQVAKFGGTTGNVFNEDGNAWCDFRVEGDTAYSLLFVDASADAVGIGTNVPRTRFHIQQTSGDTNAVRNLLTIEHNSSGTAAAGLGAGLLFALESTTTDGQSAALLDGSWSEPTHASRKGQARLWAYDDSAARLGLTIGTNGSAALVGLYATNPVAQATTGVAAATVASNGGTTITDKDTFDGYTMQQVVKALRNLGVLA